MRINWIVERCNEILFGIKAENDSLASLTAKVLDQNLSETARHGMLPVVMESLSDVKITDTPSMNIVELRRVLNMPLLHLILQFYN